MIFLPIIGLSTPDHINDWFLSAMILTLLSMLIIMGPFKDDYVRSYLSMFRFKSPDGDVSYPLLSTWQNIFIFVLSCISVGIAVGIYSHNLMKDGFSQVLFLLWYSSLVVFCFLLKLMLYTVTNKFLYNRQIITLKPGRWNCFFVMSFSVSCLLILAFSFVVVFLDIHVLALLVFAYLMRILNIAGRIFKIKTTLFKNRRSNLGFIMYLCAFELAPILIEFMLTSRLFGLI